MLTFNKSEHQSKPFEAKKLQEKAQHIHIRTELDEKVIDWAQRQALLELN